MVAAACGRWLNNFGESPYCPFTFGRFGSRPSEPGTGERNLKASEDWAHHPAGDASGIATWVAFGESRHRDGSRSLPAAARGGAVAGRLASSDWAARSAPSSDVTQSGSGPRAACQVWCQRAGECHPAGPRSYGLARRAPLTSWPSACCPWSRCRRRRGPRSRRCHAPVGTRPDGSAGRGARASSPPSPCRHEPRRPLRRAVELGEQVAGAVLVRRGRSRPPNMHHASRCLGEARRAHAAGQATRTWEGVGETPRTPGRVPPD